MRKTYVSFIFIFVTIQCALAQIPLNVETEVLYPYPTQFSVWASDVDSYMAIVTNNSSETYSFFIKTQLEGTDDGLNETFVRINEDYRPVSGFTIGPGETMMIASAEIQSTYANISLEDLSISENIPIDDINGELPSGDYRICTQLVEFSSDISIEPTLLSPIDCSDAFGVGQANIQLEFPNDGSSLDPSAPIHILWGVAGLDFAELASYSFKVNIYEVDSIQAIEESVYDLVESGDANLFFTSEEVNENTYIYDPGFGNFPMREGFTYAIQVEVVNTGGLYFDNGGKSNINIHPCESFFIDQGDGSDEPINQNQIDCFENCVLTPPQNISPLQDDNPASFQVGHFVVDSTTIDFASNGQYSGTGRIKIDWLNNVHVLVSFNNISINSDYKVTSGEVIGLEQEEQPALLDEFNDMVRAARVGAGLLGAESSVRLPLGIDYNIGGTDFLLALTNMVFVPTGADVKASCNFHMPTFGEDSWISLASSETCMHPGGFGNEFILHMDYDRPINAQGDVLISFKGSQALDKEDLKAEASYFEMDCNGLKEISLKADVFFPEEVLVPDTESGEPGEGQVKGTLGITIGRSVDEENNVYAELGGMDVPSDAGLHFIAEISIDSFQFKGVDGWAYTVQKAYLDVSEISNPPDMEVNELYEGEIDDSWSGFYLEKMQIAPPKDFFINGERVKGFVENAIFDESITMKVGIEDLFGPDKGGVKNWSLSMDQLFIDIVQNELVAGGFSGKLGAPITGDGEFLSYEALIAKNNSESGGNPQYTFTIEPSEDLTFPFAMAEASLLDNSYVELSLVPGNSEMTYVEFYPVGEININTETFQDKETFDDNGGVPLKIPVLDFSFIYNSNSGFSDVHFALFDGLELANDDVDMDFSYFDNGIESNEESLVGLPIILERLNIENISGNKFKLVIEPHIVLCPGEFGFGASTVLNFPSEYDVETKKVKLTGFNITGASVDAAIHGFNLSGELLFYNDVDQDNVGSEGLRGDLMVIIPMGMGFKMAAEFGSIRKSNNAEWNTADAFQYWYVDGMVYFGNLAGIPIGGPLAIYGIGGGLSYNMTRSRSNNDSDDVASMMSNVSDPSMQTDPEQPEAATVRRTGIQPIPDFGKFGFKFSSTVGMAPLPSLFNADVSFEAEADTDDRVAFSYFSIQGDGFLLTSIAKRYNPKFWASVSLTFENPRPGQFSMHGGLTTYVKIGPNSFPILKGTADNSGLMGTADFHVQNYKGDGNKAGFWYVHIGNPEMPFGAKFLGITGKLYAMLGYNLPTDLPLPSEIEDLFGSTNSKGDNKLTSGTISSAESRSSTSKNNAKDGVGLAFGAQGGVDLKLNALGIYAELYVFLGFDINMTHSDSRTCSFGGDVSVPGINGWYGQGRIYAGLSGALGFRFKIFGKEHDLELFGLTAAMMLQGGGPDPWWAEGRVGLKISVLNGLVKCNKSVSVRIGDQCIPQFDDPFGGVPLIANISPIPESEGVSQFEDVNITFTFPIDEISQIPIIKPNGSTAITYIEPSYKNLKFKKQNGTVIDYSTTTRRQGKKLDIQSDKNLLANKDYTIEMTLIAYEYPYGPGGPRYRVTLNDGSLWAQDTVFTFTTGENSDINDAIITSIPIRDQRYFLQDEVDSHSPKVKFNTTLGGNQFFPNEDENYNYTYYIRYVSEDGGDPIVIDLENPGSTDRLWWPNQTFDNQTLYACQLIKKTEAKNPLVAQVQQAIANGLIKNFSLAESNTEASNYDIESETEVTLATADMLDDLSYNESALFTYFFKTSKYNSLDDKLDGATSGESYIWWSNELTLNTDEKFDKFDIKGEGTKDDNGIQPQSPLINIYDPMEKTTRTYINFIGPQYTTFYEDKVDNMVYRFINQLTNRSEDNPVQGCYWRTGQFSVFAISSDLPDLNLTYTSEMDKKMTKQVLDYDDPLDDGDKSAFGNSGLLMNFAYILNGSGGIISTNNYSQTKIYFNTFDKVKEDAATLYDFGLDFINENCHGVWIDNHYPNFYDHHEKLGIPSNFTSATNNQYYIDFYHDKFKNVTNEQKGYSTKQLTWSY